MSNTIEWNDSMLGKDVTIITNKNATQRGFKSGMTYDGKILAKKDWLVGCPVFENQIGVLGVDYECRIIKIKEKLDNE